MSEYPTLKEYVLRNIKSLKKDFNFTVRQETKNLVEKVLDILPDFKFESGKPFHPSVMVYGFDVLDIELRWQYPSMMKGHFIIDFQTSDDPLSYSVYIAERHYHKSGTGTFEGLCSELVYEYRKFCLDGFLT